MSHSSFLSRCFLFLGLLLDSFLETPLLCIYYHPQFWSGSSPNDLSSFTGRRRDVDFPFVKHFSCDGDGCDNLHASTTCWSGNQVCILSSISFSLLVSHCLDEFTILRKYSYLFKINPYFLNV